MPRPKTNTTGWYGESRTRRNAENARVYTIKRRDERKQKLVEHFGDKCDDCGGTFPVCCYDFHHIDPATKSFEIAPRLNGNFQTILEEAAKCVMICSNCHRVRHYKERDV